MRQRSSLAQIPTFKLLDTLSDNNSYRPIETDFVLDLGNSRTCGILLEKPDNQDLKIETAFWLNLSLINTFTFYIFHSNLNLTIQLKVLNHLL